MRDEEEEMTQQAVSEKKPGANEQPKSKTKELRDWLRAEIQRNERAEYILRGALNTASPSANRYLDLTPDEMDEKIAQDRTKLEEVKARLELLRSARELDVDIDAMEKAGVKVSRMASQEVIFEGYYRVTGMHVGYKFRIDAGRRHLTLSCFVFGHDPEIFSIGIVACTYDSVVNFKVQRDFPGRMNEHELVLTLLPYNYLVINY